MVQVADWLKSLGMSEYLQIFAENRIDSAVLRDLTDQDLKDLGVVLGDRRKLLRAIAGLSNTPVRQAEPEPSQATSPQDVVAPPPIRTVPEVTGERRYLTVLFCDLVGSTSISAQLDAEEWRDLVNAYLDSASAAVTEMGGYVAKKLGDGLMALFGYPAAHENDAERAARAAISIQRALAELNRKNSGTSKRELSARIGLETGPAVVDATGEVYGEVANIAALIQATAEPGVVLATARVQRQIAGLFVVEERGTLSLEGVPEPTTLYRLVRASGGGRRAPRPNLTPLIGRDEEIATLTRRWERARQGDGQLVLIVSEPGLGKSRLIEEFHQRVRAVAHTWTEWSCSQLLQNTPLHPVAEWGRQRFGGPDIPAERRLSDLEHTLAPVKLDPAENVPLLAPLLDIPLPQGHALTLAPDELRRRQLVALVNWVIASAKLQPVVLAFEDLHWADPTTLDVLRAIAERGAQTPLLVVATMRPEFRPSWRMRSHHCMISLSPLDHKQVCDMVAELAARHALPASIVEDVAARTGGVPLFVEEVTRLLLEHDPQSGSHEIPPTLQQSLMARLDRLGPAREVAQVASVIGRDFSYPLIRTLAGMEDQPLQGALEKLAEADILLVQGVAPYSDYRFKHVLLQDAAYENLLKSRRQGLHRRVAEILHEQAAEGVANEPELLARHYTQAGMNEAAIEWWGKAGQRSLERSALKEALEQFTRALALFPANPDTPAQRREQIKLQVALIAPLMHVRGYGAPETKAAVERAHSLIQAAEALGEPSEDPLLLFSVLYGLWAGSVLSAFNGDALRELSMQLLSLAEQQGTAAPLLLARRIMGTSLLFTGEFAKSRAYLDQAISLYDPSQHRPLAIRFGLDIGPTSLFYRSSADWYLGYPDAALGEADNALREARAIGHAATLMVAMGVTSLTRLLRGDYPAASKILNELDVLAEQKGSAQWKAFGVSIQGCQAALTGDAYYAVQTINSGVEAWQSTGSTTLYGPIWSLHLAIAYVRLDQFDNAWRCITEAMTAIETTKERWWEAEINRIAGEISLRSPQGDITAAGSYFDRALAVAREQQAKSWELRTATSLARLWHKRDEPQQALAVLTPVYGWFTEGFDTRDLKEAKELLHSLAS